MRQHVRVGVLASLLMVPSVLANANGQLTTEDVHTQINIQQEAVGANLLENKQVSAVAPLNENTNDENDKFIKATTIVNQTQPKAIRMVKSAVASISGTTSGDSATSDTGSAITPKSNIDKERIEELQTIGENTIIANFERYKTWVSDLQANNSITSAQATFLKDKISYLEQYDKIKLQAGTLNEELKLLKATNATTIQVVQQLTGELATLEAQYKQIRKDFHEKYNAFYKNAVTFATQSVTVASMPNFNDTTESFLVKNLKNYSNFLKFKQEIVKPNELITGVAVTTADSGSTTTTGDTGGLTAEQKAKLFIELYAFDKIPTDENALKTYAEDMREAYDALIMYYTSEFTADEKKIFESHVYNADPKSRTVKAILDSMKKDLDAAKKVNDTILDFNPNGLTASAFNSKMKSILNAYGKLTDRQQALVGAYREKVDIKDTEVDLLGAYQVSLAIASLKAKNTDDYRVELFKARIAYDKLESTTGDAASVKQFVKNYSILEGLEADFQQAVGKVEETSAGSGEAIVVDGKVQINYTPGSTMTPEGLIKQLSTSTIITLEQIQAARQAYDKLTSQQKKLVNNYKELQTWEKNSKSSVKLQDQIAKIKIENSKKFASDVAKAEKAAAKLTDQQKKLVSNLERIDYLSPFATTITNLNKVKLSNKPEYREQVGTTAGPGMIHNLLAIAVTGDTVEVVSGDSAKITALKTALQKIIDEKRAEVTSAESVEVLIQHAKNETDRVKQLEQTIAAREAYSTLPKNIQKIVNNLKVLTDLEKGMKQSVKVVGMINNVDPGSTKFPSTSKSAVSAFDKLTSTQKGYINVEAKNKIADFKTFLAFYEQVKALKPAAPTFQDDLKKARAVYNDLTNTSTTAWKTTDADYKKQLIDAVKAYEPTMIYYESEVINGNGLVVLIDKLAVETNGEEFFKLVDQIEAEYAKLSANGKKQVTNYKLFQTLKKDGTAAFKVIELILNNVIINQDVLNPSYEKAMEKAIKAYDKITPKQKAYVYNYNSRIKPQLKVYELVVMINKLKPTAKTYREDVAAIRKAYDSLSKDEQVIAEPLLYKISGAETGLEDVNKVMDLIDEATPDKEDYVKRLEEARKAYDQLARINSSYQKLVLNYKVLVEREKEMKPVTTSIYQIIELKELISRPMNDAVIFVKKYQTAVKDYEKIPYENRGLVYNRDVLLKEIYPVASTMEAILNIKTTNKTFGADVRKAREWYDGLSATDKALITNYSDLLAFEEIVGGGAEVDAMIAEIPKTPTASYMQAIREARAAYNALSADEKKAVTLYKDLQNYEKGVANVLAAIDAIDNMQHATNLVAAYDKATKILEKLTADERLMVNNINKLKNVGPAIEVYKQIEALKVGSEGYSGAVQAIYAAYNRLTTTEKQYVTNFAKLQEAKNNIDNLAEVIAKIASITPGSRDYAKQVQEALALYNTLPAAMKKQVTNISVLTNSEKEITAAQKVRSMISEIDVNSANFVEKTLAARAAYDKLSTTEKRLVSNYFLLEDFELQLGNMF